VNTPAFKRLNGVSLACVMVCALLAATSDVRAQSGPADSLVPTAIEEALIEVRDRRHSYHGV